MTRVTQTYLYDITTPVPAEWLDTWCRTMPSGTVEIYLCLEGRSISASTSTLLARYTAETREEDTDRLNLLDKGLATLSSAWYPRAVTMVFVSPRDLAHLKLAIVR